MKTSENLASRCKLIRVYLGRTCAILITIAAFAWAVALAQPTYKQQESEVLSDHASVTPAEKIWEDDFYLTDTKSMGPAKAMMEPMKEMMQLRKGPGLTERLPRKLTAGMASKDQTCHCECGK